MTTAKFTHVGAIGADDLGNLYVADHDNYGLMYPSDDPFIVRAHIRKISPDGVVSTVAVVEGAVYQIVPHKSGNIYIVSRPPHPAYYDDTWGVVGKNLVRKLSPTGAISVVAGGGTSLEDGVLATDALVILWNIAVDDDETVYIGEFLGDGIGSRVRRVDPQTGIITTIAGGGTSGALKSYATQAQLFGDYIGVALMPSGDLAIADGKSIALLEGKTPPYVADRIIIASADASEHYHFDESGRHLKTVNTRTGAALRTFGYTNGLLTTITDADGNVVTIARDGTGRATAIRGPLEQQTALDYDGNGWLRKITDPLGQSHTAEYAAGGHMQTFSRPRGHASTFTYDAKDRLTRDENAAGGYWQLSRTEQANGFTVTLNSALGRSKVYRVEHLLAGGERRENTELDGTKTIITSKPDGTTTIAAPDGTVTTQSKHADPRYGMQAPLRNETIRVPSGISAAIETTRTATLQQRNDPTTLIQETTTTKFNGRPFTEVYDGASRQTTYTTPVGRSSIVSTDVAGRPTVVQVGGLDAINYAYDPQGRLQSVTQGSGATQRALTYSYDAKGLQTVTDALSQSVVYQRDLIGRPTQVTLPGNRQLGVGHDPNSNLAGLTPPGRPEHGFTYNKVDLETHYTPPSVPGITNPTTEVHYNLDKQVTRIDRPDGSSLAYAYVPGKSLLTSITPSAGAGDAINLAYSPTSAQLASVGTADALTAFTYDGFLLKSQTVSGSVAGSIVWTYDNDFRVQSHKVNGVDTAFGYDNDNLLTQTGALSITRHPQHGMATGTSLGSIATTQSYSGFGEPHVFTVSHGGSTLYRSELGYDRAGRVTSRTETIQGVATQYEYEYDAASRLQTVKRNGTQTASYGYDANGNRTHENGALVASFDAQDRIQSQGATSYQFTAAGALQQKAQGAQTTGYVYDAFGNLRSVALPGGGQIAYLADGSGRRIGKKVNGTLVQGFVYQDQLRIAAELDGSGATVALFTYAEKANVPEYMVKGGTTYRIVTDHLGSVRLVADTATGAVAQRIDYDEWGRVTSDSNPGFQPFGFAGGLYDKDTGLVRFGARDYDAGIGRWTAKDPIGFGGGDSNLYGYVNNSPVTLTDPLGLMGVGGGGSASHRGSSGKSKDCECQGINPVKAGVALGNATIAGFSAASAGVKVAIAAGLSPASATGVGALPPAALVAWAMWNMKGSQAAWDRSMTQWREAMCEGPGKASWKNLQGLLPGGTQYDDAGEYANPWEYIQDQGWGKFLGEAGYF
ncbi:hypothetical protein HLB44_19360 [Aquincola sp. S2]|uniref:Teneurin-like YD-shell domain-containing protein n=1 Tax=Pseudaquabacterium terrae TaxID=2732868 RepID=A0ABX2EKR2_9BURK|nr:RHS repeat-associated core domain-containing protein [Aquabacterium terrae]NRF69157.1 hypothetical protein [Aquabacterium terrae]